jgi:hypothetical protein
MRIAVVLACVLALLSPACKTSEARAVEPQAVPVPLEPVAVEPAIVAPTVPQDLEAQPKPSLLSLFALTAAVIGTVANHGENPCKSDACLAATIADTTVQLHAVVMPERAQTATR